MTDLVLAVDGNSLLHRSYHALASTGARSAQGEPVWAIRGLLTQLVAAAERVGPSVVVVGFDDPDRSLRRERWPDYKAQRAAKLPTLTSQLARAAAELSSLGIHCVTPPGLEADDVLASTAAAAARRGDRTVVVTSDRDAFALISEHTSVLRVINGGIEASPLLTPERLVTLLGVRPELYSDLAALRGDPSDNLPGVHGIGPKRAARLLNHFGGAEAVFDDVASGGRAVAEVLGRQWPRRLADPSARERWLRNRDLMRFHDDLDCGLSGDDLPGRLPLDAVAVHRTILGHGLPFTARLARRVLGGVEPPEAEPPIVDQLGWDPSAEWRARPSNSPGSRAPLPSRTVNRQPTLF